MGEKPRAEKPEVLRMEAWRTSIDRLVPKCHFTTVKNIEGVGTIGFYFMPPGELTNTFSMEHEDDGTADEYYGPCHEFYLIICGEFTMYWGRDASEIRDERSDKLVLKAGEVGHWTPGWKYAVKNTGNVPGTFFWGLSKPPKGTVTR